MVQSLDGLSSALFGVSAYAPAPLNRTLRFEVWAWTGVLVAVGALVPETGVEVAGVGVRVPLAAGVAVELGRGVDVRTGVEVRTGVAVGGGGRAPPLR